MDQDGDPRLVALVRELAYQAAEEDHYAEIERSRAARLPWQPYPEVSGFRAFDVPGDGNSVT